MLQRARGAAGAALALALIATGCGASATPAAPSAGTPAGSGPVKPKVNRVVMAVEPPGREGNEGRHQSAPDNWQLKPIYEYLIGMASDEGKLIPELATDWAVLPDGKSIQFNLRKGVQFHKGYGEFTAKDLIPTWQEIVKEDSLAGASPFWRLALQEIEIVNDYQAIYHLKRPDGNVLTSISRFRGGMEMFSKADYDKNGPGEELLRGPTVGTGPYQFSERKQAQYLRYERAPFQQWRATPEFPEFEFRFIKEASTRFASLLAGEVHLADLPQDLRQQGKQRGLKGILAKDPSLRTSIHIYGAFLNDGRERTPTPDDSKGWMYPDSPVMDVRVRRALSKALDREALNKAFFGGEGRPMYNSHFSATRMGWNPTWEARFKEEYAYDPEAARRLLAAAGYGPGKPMPINIELQKPYGYSGGEDVAEAIAAMWRAVGIQPQFITRDPTDHANQRRAFKLNNHVVLNGTGSDQWTGVTTYGSTQGSRTLGVELPESNKLLDQIANTLDEKKQKELWKQVGEILYTQHKEVPLFWLPIEAIADPKIVADWTYPGSATGSWTHVENIKAAR